ncbi:entericidin A/B family lipoprotein [Stenotrophomonas sp. PS02298]|nr:entericidin A/B family lipoprotein [Stenotrophomonas sp. PS02298]
MKRLVALMMLSLFSVAVLAGCNTVAGAGKDVQKVGEKVEGAAKGH